MAEQDVDAENSVSSTASPPPNIIVDHESTMDDVLEWIGFGDAERRSLLKQLGNTLTLFLSVTTSELDQLANDMKKLAAPNKVIIGFNRLRMLKGVIHWAQDKERLGMKVMIMVDGFDKSIAHFEFLEELEKSMKRQLIRAKSTDSLEARAKAASPGKLKDERNWDKWEMNLVLMLSILRGVSGVPLSYVIRETEHKDGDTYNDSFLDQSIARVHLKGPTFEADARTVHEILETLTNGESAANWLKDLKNKHDGRKDMVALRSHFRGAGNQSRRIANAQALHNTLHYKNERAMKFSDFISKTKEMFDIFADCNEPYVESNKLRFLWEKIDSTILHTPMEIMKADLSRDPGSWTFVSACDHLASQVPIDGKPSVKFQASAVERETGNSKSNIMRQGKIHVGSYEHDEWFNVLTKDERDQVSAERRKSGKPYAGKKSKKNGQAKYDRKVQALQKQLKKSKKQISSMRRATKESDDDSDSDSTSDADDAGNSFGGKAERIRQKKKKRKKS